MTVERRFLFIVNESAGGGGTSRRLAATLDRAPHIARCSRVAAVDGLHEAAEAVRRLEADTVPVATGGDGTVHLLVRALREVGLGERLIGVLPLGTGNAFAHEVGASTVSRALRVLSDGRPVARDVMITTHPAAPLALLSLSTGFESRVMQQLHRGHRSSRGWGLVVGTALGAAQARTTVGLSADGVALADGEPVCNAGLYNTRHYGFGRLVFPDADPADGSGEAVVCERIWDYGAALSRGIRAIPGGVSRRGVRVRSWRVATLVATGPVQVDGEPAPAGTFEVRIVAGALRVLSA